MSSGESFRPISSKATLDVVQLIPEADDDWHSFVHDGGLREALDTWTQSGNVYNSLYKDDEDGIPDELLETCMTEQRKNGLEGRQLAVAVLRQMATDTELRQRLIAEDRGPEPDEDERFADCFEDWYGYTGSRKPEDWEDWWKDGGREGISETRVYRDWLDRGQRLESTWKTAAQQVDYYCEHPEYAAAMRRGSTDRRKLVSSCLKQYGLTTPFNVEDLPAYQRLLSGLPPSASRDQEEDLAWKAVDEIAAARFGNTNAFKWIKMLSGFSRNSTQTSLKILLPNNKHPHRAVAPLQAVARSRGFDPDDQMKPVQTGHRKRRNKGERPYLMVYKTGHKPPAGAGTSSSKAA